MKIGDLAESIKNLGAEYDERLLAKADESFEGKIVDCEDKKAIKKVLNNGKKLLGLIFVLLRIMVLSVRGILRRNCRRGLWGLVLIWMRRLGGSVLFVGRRLMRLFMRGKAID